MKTKMTSGKGVMVHKQVEAAEPTRQRGRPRRGLPSFRARPQHRLCRRPRPRLHRGRAARPQGHQIALSLPFESTSLCLHHFLLHCVRTPRQFDQHEKARTSAYCQSSGCEGGYMHSNSIHEGTDLQGSCRLSEGVERVGCDAGAGDTAFARGRVVLGGPQAVEHME